MIKISRRQLLQNLSAVAATAPLLTVADCFAAKTAGKQYSLKFGLVTYMLAAKWDLPTLIKNCTAAKVHGVELRTTHKHGVELSLSAQQRKDVGKRFADSAISWVAIGANSRFDSPKKKELKANIEETKAFLKLSHDIGGTGVKVKPNSFHKKVPHEKTIAQIGKSLNELGKFAAEYNQEVRLEVHGSCSKLPTIKKIMDIATHKNVGVCWNSNSVDLTGKGLEHNFNLVKDRFGDTVHVRELDTKKYPYAKLFKLLKQAKYDGWILMEHRSPKDGKNLPELIRQRKLFEKLIG